MNPNAATNDAEESPTGNPHGTPRIHGRSSEWLETDGRSGFACGSEDGALRRRYHGLLVAPASGSPKRYNFVSDLEIRVDTGNAVHSTRHVCGPGGAHRDDAAGFRDEFDIEPFPTHRFSDPETGVRIERSILMPKGHHAVLCRIQLDLEAPAELRLRPFLPFREADALTIHNDVFDPSFRIVVDESEQGFGLGFRPYAALPEIVLSYDDEEAGSRFEWVEELHWDHGLGFPIDEERGYHGSEDQASPGCLRAELDKGSHTIVLCFAVDRRVQSPARLWERVARIRRATWQLADARSVGRPESRIRSRLDTTADDFFQVDANGRLGLCAGFPWFLEWGRDTFLSLPGLTLPRDRLPQCRNALLTTSRFLLDGLIPNVFGADRADSLYNSADASLWFLRAIDLYLDECVRSKICERGSLPADDGPLADAIDQILDRYTRAEPEASEPPESTSQGERRPDLAIWLGDDGLLRAGTEELNATWMDAKTSRGPVTPRAGSPVELQALLYSGLDLAHELATGRGDEIAARRHGDRRDLVGRALRERFVVKDQHGTFLADRIDEHGEPVLEVRPNMVLASALRRSPLKVEETTAVVERCDRDLLTARGLRTLSPDDPQYQPCYDGDQDTRDHAYHQGTVWPWLIGSYVEASLVVRGPEDEPRLRTLLDGFADEFDQCGLGHVSEVFDGAPPHQPAGTFAQAWNTAELLRATAMLDRASDDRAAGARSSASGNPRVTKTTNRGASK